MDQPTFAGLEYDSKKRKTRREIFLDRMDSLSARLVVIYYFGS